MEKFKTFVLGIIVAASTVAGVPKPAEAVRGNIYDSWERPFTALPYYYQNAQNWEGDAYCQSRYKTLKYVSNRIGYIDTFNGTIETNKVTYQWAHKANGHCVLNFDWWR